MKYIFTSFLALGLLLYVEAQNISIGALCGWSGYPENSHLIGVSSELAPEFGYFSVSSELQYMFGTQNLILPTALNVYTGKVLKPRVFGGILPIMRIVPIAPLKKLELGGFWGLGLDLTLRKRWTIGSQISILYMDTVYYDKFTGSPYLFEGNSFLSITIGLKYRIYSSKAW
jgi:hypothetical protein